MINYAIRRINMKIYFVIVSFFVLVSFVQFGCKGSNGDVGPAGPLLKGNLIGHAYLSDENINADVTDFRGILVTIDGTANSAMTDSTGKYELDNVETGILNFTLSKNGYGTTKIVMFQFVGGGDAFLPGVALGQAPTFDVTKISTLDTGLFITVFGKITNTAPYERNVLMFEGKTRAVSSNPSNYLGTDELSIAPDSITFTYQLWKSNFIVDSGFSYGDTVFYAVYSHGGDGSSYIDFETQRRYTTALTTGSPIKGFFVLQ